MSISSLVVESSKVGFRLMKEADVWSIFGSSSDVNSKGAYLWSAL